MLESTEQSEILSISSFWWMKRKIWRHIFLLYPKLKLDLIMPRCFYVLIWSPYSPRRRLLSVSSIASNTIVILTNMTITVEIDLWPMTTLRWYDQWLWPLPSGAQVSIIIWCWYFRQILNSFINEILVKISYWNLGQSFSWIQLCDLWLTTSY